jgi:hypothetical protein
MKRLLFPAFVASALAAGFLALAACDPDLGIVKTPGEGGTSEASATDAPVTPPPSEAGTTSEGGTDEGGTEAGVVTHVIDGTNDFTAGEKLATSSAGYDAYVSWDDKKVYFGMSGADIGTTATNKWVLIYVDGVPGNAGTPTGIAYDCGGTCAPGQQAHLPFNAGYHLRWKVDGTYSNLQKSTGVVATPWSDVGPISTFVRTGNFMEISVTRALFGSPTKLKVHVSMLIEAADPPGWTYAGVPSGSFTDGYNPASFSKYFEFDLADLAKAPSAYAPKP